jgi:hypothetical protein
MQGKEDKRLVNCRVKIPEKTEIATKPPLGGAA